MRTWGWIPAALVMAATSTGMARAAATGYTITMVAATGDPVPGGGQFLREYEPWALNGQGDMAFAANLDANGDQGDFLYHDGKLSDVIRYDQLVPGPGGMEMGLGQLGRIGLDDSGNMAFTWLLAPFKSPLGVNAAAYRFPAASQALEPVVMPGVTPAPGGGTFAGLGFDSQLNQRGDLAFTGIVSSSQGLQVGLQDAAYPGLGFGVYVMNAQGTVTKIASAGDPAPGGGTFDLVSDPSINSAGDVAFIGHTMESQPCQDPSAKSCAIKTAVYVRRAATGQLEPIARPGDAVSGTTLAGAGQEGFASTLINSEGDVLFKATLSSGARAILLHTTSGTTVVAATGAAIQPGGPKVTSLPALDLNDSGDVAFNAGLDNGQEALYLYSAGVLRVIAGTGTTLPGGGTIANLEAGSSAPPGQAPSPTGVPFGILSVNDRGQVAFDATLADGRTGMFIAAPTAAAGPLTVGDAVLALRIAIGKLTATADQLTSLDVNGDGRIDIVDATLILQKAIGL